MKKILLLLLNISIMVNAQTTFTRADTLRGTLSAERACYNVTFYHLDVRIDPQKKYLSGSNTVVFSVVNDFRRMQIDLYENMAVDSILLDGRDQATFDRIADAVMVDLPRDLKKNENHRIKIFYRGNPVVAKRPPWSGGFTWEKDSTGNPWVVVTCQGDGASLWWPNKDHQSDEPDSMLISITIPPGLEDISNGRLRSKEVLPDGWQRFNWFVSYPINNYNVTVNIGKYAHFNDHFIGETDTLSLDYYVLPENLDKAREHFKQVPGMMECFEHYFGPYPFVRDGYKLIECPHTGMEHQSAVAYGNHYLGGYRGFAPSAAGLKFDFIIIHESAHEWWGNNVTSNDIADMWIHESFGAYAEALYIEYFYGYDEAMKYINGKKQGVRNDRPIIGPFGVNHAGSGDMYNKGQLILNTLRHVIDDDPLWFSIIRGIQDTFKYRSIDGRDVFNYINFRTGQDLNYFFEQYFNRTELPQLDISLIRKGEKTSARYRWTADVENFCMPVKISMPDGKREFIHPSGEWQILELNGMDPKDFQVMEDQFFIRLNLHWNYLDPQLPDRK